MPYTPIAIQPTFRFVVKVPFKLFATKIEAPVEVVVHATENLSTPPALAFIVLHSIIGICVNEVGNVILTLKLPYCGTLEQTIVTTPV